MLLALENSHIWAQAVCNDIYAVHRRVPSNNADDVNDSVNSYSLSLWVAKRLKRGREEENNFCSIACIINHFLHAAMKSLFSVKKRDENKSEMWIFFGQWRWVPHAFLHRCVHSSECLLRQRDSALMTLWRCGENRECSVFNVFLIEPLKSADVSACFLSSLHSFHVQIISCSFKCKLLSITLLTFVMCFTSWHRHNKTAVSQTSEVHQRLIDREQLESERRRWERGKKTYKRQICADFRRRFSFNFHQTIFFDTSTERQPINANEQTEAEILSPHISKI